VTEPLVRWLLTYLVHSTVLLGAAWLARVALRDRRLALQEAVLRAALVGGFVTASLQVGLDLRPLGGALAVPAPRPVAAVGTAAVPVVHAGLAGEPAAWRGRPVSTSAVPPWAWPVAEAVAARWRVGLGAAWAGLALLALARLAVAALRLRRLLHGRRPIAAGELAPGAAALGPALGLRSPVRLSAAERLPAPLATGVLRPEVCLPTRAVAELGADEQVALCAHELAHLARRDPAWILLARLAEAAAPTQPLNAWARRRLQDLAECLSDDLAVAASGRPLGLARSLVDVASWTLGERPFLPVAAAGALSARSRLGHRVERLMDTARTLERPRRLLLPAAAIAVLATALVTPVVSGNAAPQAPAPEAQPAPAARPVPEARPAPEAEPEPEAQLQALSRRIEERARLHEGEMRRLEAEIEAIASKMKPAEADMERLSEEIGKAAEALAESVREDLEAGTKGTARKSERTAEAARRMAEAEARLHAATSEIRIPSEDIRALAEKARALAEQVRPTEDELREIRHLSEGAARRGADQARDAMRIAEEALRQAREALRRASEQPKD
jgi:beta-lactamase regulating signal transducer with metallopeptidase domain